MRRTGHRAHWAVLFDLDGTLVDSAPDLAARGNALRAARGLPPLPLEQLRPHGRQRRARHGRRRPAASTPSDAQFDALRDGVPRALRGRILRRHPPLRRHGAVLDGARRARPALGHRHQQGRPLLRRCWSKAGPGRARRLRSSRRHHAACQAAPAAAAGGGAAPGAGAAATASTSATTCATCRPGAPPACARWRPPGATWRGERTAGTPTPCIAQPAVLIEWIWPHMG